MIPQHSKCFGAPIIVATILLAVSVLFTSCAAASPLQKMATGIIHDYGQKYHLSGISITMQCPSYHQGQPETAYAGSMGLDDPRPLTHDAIFQIGSITKSFIAVVLLQLATEHVQGFSLDDTVGKWFGNAYPKWRTIKISQLLNMTSQIPNYTDDKSFFKDVAKHPYAYIALERILDLVKNKPLDPIDPKTGNQYEYSNTNYILAGLLIERLTGHSVEEEVTQRIIKKLGLRHTFFPAHLPEEVVPVDKLVHGYSFSSKAYFIQQGTDVSRGSLSWAGAAGAILSTTADINSYARALFTPGKLLTEREEKQLTTLVSMKTGKPITDVSANDPGGYGLGIGKAMRNGDKFYFYTGETLGFAFFYAYYPTRQSSFVFTINSVGDNNFPPIAKQLSAGFAKYCRKPDP